jgi:hypothetical protein
MTSNLKESEALSLAYSKFESVVAMVNELTRKIENREIRLQVLSQIEAPFDLPLENQILFKKGLLSIDTGYRMKERHVLLFGNVLLICKPSIHNYILESGYLISDLEMPNDPIGNFVKDTKGPRCSINLYVISENLAQLSISADSEQSRNEWVKYFDQAFNLSFDEKSREIDMLLDLDLKMMRRNIKAKNTIASHLKIKKKVLFPKINHSLML